MAALRFPIITFLAGTLFGAGALAQQSGTITLTGTVAQNCTVLITPSAAASSLDLSNGSYRIQVGTALQNCNKNAGFTLHVLSQNCTTGTPGAKLIGTVSAEMLGYSVEFNNPTTGGSQAVVTGLLGTACSGAAAVTGRNVTGAKITNETSTIFVNYTGSNGLASDSYGDVLTIAIVVK